MLFSGLTEREVHSRLKQFGYNELKSSSSNNLSHIAVSLIKEPLFVLLLACGILYMTIGDYQEGIILVFTILIIICITFFQQRKTYKALEALKSLASPRALVVRDGIQKRISGREIVPDDIVILNEGDRVPADGTLIECFNLNCDESIITGESFSVLKTQNTLLLSGSLVVKGRGTIKVCATGNQTQFGKIGKSLGEITEEVTPLQKELKKFIKILGLIGALLCIVIILLFYVTRGQFIHAVLNGLSTAIAILPEEFPVVMTVFLALGAWRLSKKNVLTRKSSAIETLGAATVLCCDKTGTITQNKMAVASIYTNHTFFNPAEFNTEPFVHQIAQTATLASIPNSSDPMENALFRLTETLHADAHSYTFVKEFSFSHDFRAMSRVYTTSDTSMLFVAAKGSPEAIFKLCNCSKAELDNYTIVLNELASKGFRVIGIASTYLENSKIPEKQEAISFEFNGLIALEDPIRPEVTAAVDECLKAGIRIIMITGDFKETAINIAAQIGLENDIALTGEEVDLLNDADLDSIIKTASIIARVKPEQKLRIVESLKRNQEVVAMTGDGVNDAPALKAAHIGIAMGNKGTDVARETASLVLLDDNFASIVAAIRMGRKIFDNLQKAMSYIIAIHIPIIGLTLLPAFSSSFLIVLMPIHIVFLELVIDPISSVAFESEHEELGIMNKPPRKQNQALFGSHQIMQSIVEGLLLLCTVLLVIYFSINERHTEKEIRSICFSALVIGNIFMIYSSLSKTRSFMYVFYSKNNAVKLISLASLVLLYMTISIPWLSALFSFEFPGVRHFILAFTLSCILLLVLELLKYRRLKAE
jgi:Ca2+-transporting ATPase